MHTFTNRKLASIPAKYKRAPKSTKARQSPCRHRKAINMAKSKKHKRAKRTQCAHSTRKAPFSVCRLAHPFVALAISKDPSRWSEQSLDGPGDHGYWISGANIKLPIFENEYRLELGESKGEKHIFPHFLMHMETLTSFRIFHMTGANDFFICTDADEQTVNIALAFARQIAE